MLVAERPFGVHVYFDGVGQDPQNDTDDGDNRSLDCVAAVDAVLDELFNELGECQQWEERVVYQFLRQLLYCAIFRYTLTSTYAGIISVVVEQVVGQLRDLVAAKRTDRAPRPARRRSVRVAGLTLRLSSAFGVRHIHPYYML